MIIMSDLKTLISECHIPGPNDKVYKDECAFSFDNPESSDGLFICMKQFLGLGKQFVDPYHKKTGNRLFLQYKIVKRAKKNNEAEGSTVGEAPGKRTKLAIGVEGGFDLPQDAYTLEEHYSLVVLPEWTVFSLPCDSVPEPVAQSISKICAADSALLAEERAATVAAWEAEGRVESAHARDLKQLDNGVRIPTGGWKCSLCDMKENLWLNLTDGTILCGRRFWDGSGGNNHAVEYYGTTGFPLAVKLGTITPQGADVYSYAEDDMVLDPLLSKHLAHFGIDIMRMEKTDNTMMEMEIQINERLGEWAAIQELDQTLEPLYGPRHTGIRNLGNSCYLNSVIQVLFTIPDFCERYTMSSDYLIQSCGAEPAQDFRIQMSKLANGLLSGDYSKARSDNPPNGDEMSGQETSDIIPPLPGIRPQMLKLVVGRGHPEFSSKRQQDAQEFLLHLLSLVEKELVKNPGGPDPTDALRFQVEDRLECGATKQVRYMNRSEFLLSLPIPLDALTNADEMATYEANKKMLESQGQKIDPNLIVRPVISFDACLNAFMATECIEDFASPAAQGQRVNAFKTTRLASFPDCLFVHMRKFALGPDWVPTKLDVELQIPDTIDISSMRARGLQPGEVLMPESAGPAAPSVVIDAATVEQLVSMGFPETSCKKAVHRTGNTGVEAAMNWIMEHMEDPDFADPLPELNSTPAQTAPGSEVPPSDEAICMMEAMGFDRSQALRALKATGNNLERAADWAFSHMDELNQPEPAVNQPANQSGTSQQLPKCRDGCGQYRLFAFISHMGTSSQAGHYVCHIKRGNQWVIYNDEKVAKSEHPPRHLAYIYCFRRADLPECHDKAPPAHTHV